MLLAKLGRQNVAILLKTQENMERPSDIQGLIYIPFKDDMWTYHVNMRLAGRFIPRASILAAADTLELVEAYRLEDQETEAMRWTVCGAGLKATKTDLPFKVSIDDAVLRRVDEIVARADGGTELEIIRYAA